MRRDPESLAHTGKVVHVVGAVTDQVFSFLGPASHAVARTGREQMIVMIDEMRYRHHLANLHESAELIMAPAQRNPFKQWSAVHDASRKALLSGPLHAIHLHGMLPALVGARAVRSTRVDAPVFFSPHAGGMINTLGSLGLLVRALLRTTRNAAIVSAPQESTAFDSWQSSQLVECPVGEVFFTVKRREARYPLIITGGSSQVAQGAALVAQLAVLLSSAELRISFNWIGAVDEVSRLSLKAAGVGLFGAVGDTECAARLAGGWLHLAPVATRGFPLFLVEAMAAGLPCVAFDCAQHREVIRDGETGFLCKTDREMIETIALLIDDARLRSRIGEEARRSARARFAASDFDAKLLAAYAQHSESQPGELRA